MLPRKLECKDILYILKLYWDYNATIVNIAEYFGVDVKVIRAIVGGKHYKDCYNPKMFGFGSYKEMDVARLERGNMYRTMYGRNNPSPSIEILMEEIKGNKNG